jgi:hypothetical protein
MILVIGIETVVVVVVEMKYIHLLLVDDELMLMNIDFDIVVEYYS